MGSPFGGQRDLGRPVLVALTTTTVVAALGVALAFAGLEGPAVLAAETALVLGALLAVVLLVRRSLAGPWRARAPWLLLVTAVLVLVGLQAPALDGATATGLLLPSAGRYVVEALAVAALLLLPHPVESRRTRSRTVLDAAVAGFALAVPAFEVLVPSGAPLPDLATVARPLADVLVATVAVAVLARARRPGGLPILPLAALAVGTVVVATSDELVPGGRGLPVSLGLYTLGLLTWALAALLPSSDLESDRAIRWRERIAVLVPVAPLTAAAVVLLGSAVREKPLGTVTLACAALLAVTLVVTGVLARLDGLVTERSMEELVLKRTMSLGSREKWFRSLVQNASDVITVVDVRGVVRFQTPSVTRILGHDPQQVVGTQVTDLLRPADARRLRTALATSARTPGRPVSLDFPVWAKDGSWRDTETTITSLLHDPDIRGLVLTTRDVSERRRLEEALTQQAFSDELTGLANRSLFRSKVEVALKVALAPGEVAVLFLDLDGFKAVNDAQGHLVGDELLRVVARRLTGSVRPGDVVARLGGDEFAILVTGQGAESGSVWVADRVRRALAAPFVLDGKEVSLGASTGIAVSDTGDETADQLLRNADLAMYRAKSQREGSFVRFEAEMHDELLERVQAENDLRQAVVRGDLVLHYQPVVELASRRIVGVEALVRWAHPEVGLISPHRFIELAEETGLVSDIGRWALHEAARQGADWQRYATAERPFKVAVNVSTRQLVSGLPRQVRDVLASTGLPGPALTLEMTESVLMERTDEAVELLRRMKTLGVKVAVDDFGTGYSSLSYLSRFPVDILKIDQSFVQHLGTVGGQDELVRTIVRLGESLHLDTVAEGIETPEQRAALEAMGCTYGQGFLFARPLPAQELTELLEEQAVGDIADLDPDADDVARVG
ncbi:MAG TPA: EAL domain-containing protein [Actinomycetes bacterium]|nr:EAL domain-containing protein [Actinomycetes bacterium]